MVTSCYKVLKSKFRPGNIVWSTRTREKSEFCWDSRRLIDFDTTDRFRKEPIGKSTFRAAGS